MADEDAGTPGWVHLCGEKRREVWTVSGTDCAFCDQVEPRPPTYPLGGRGGRSSTGDRLRDNFTRVKL